MRTVTVTLTLQQRDRLLKFLDRARLDGAEVPAFVEIRNLLTSAKTDAESIHPK